MRKIILSAALFCAASLNLAAFDMDHKTFNSKTIKGSDELKGLNDFDSGHYKTIINMSNMPAGVKFTVVNDRTAIGSLGQQTVDTFSREDLTTVTSPTGEKIPCFVVSGKGFLPGERVTLKFQAEDGSVSAVNVQPYPLYDRNGNGDAFIFAELKDIKPVSYELVGKGLKDGEELEFITTAGKAKETFKVKYEAGKPMVYLPNIKKGRSGNSHLIIKRENGETFDLYLPWGIQLTKFIKGKIKPGV